MYLFLQKVELLKNIKIYRPDFTQIQKLSNLKQIVLGLYLLFRALKPKSYTKDKPSLKGHGASFKVKITSAQFFSTPKIL